MDRAEAAGLGVAVAGHGLLLAILSLGFASTRIPPIPSQPVEVSFVEEVGLQSTAPQPSSESPAPPLAPDTAPPAPAAAAPAAEALPQPAPPLRAAQPIPQPSGSIPRPVQPRVATPPRAVPGRSVPAPAAPAPTRVVQPRPTGRLSGLLNGIGKSEVQSRATTPPAAMGGPAVEASLIAEVRRQIKPHWQRAVPSGADAEKLRTEVTISLTRSGAVSGIRVVGTTGQTASNRPQVELHQERAKRAIALAAPFQLPAQYYENWKELSVTLDLRLSQ